MVGFKKRP